MTKRFIAALLFLIGTVSVSAQYYMNVFRNDGARVLYNIASIDSVSVQPADNSSEPSNNYQLVIYADYGHNPVYFNTNLIDSITYKAIDPDDISAIYSVKRVSDDIIAFESNGWATVRIRTTPFDLLLNNSEHAQIRISDTSGTPDDTFEMGDREFSSEDSIWNVKIRLKNSSATEGRCAISVVCDSVIAVSKAFTVRKVSFKMNSVKVYNNQTMSFDSKSNTYSYCLPTTTDFSEQKFLFSHNGDKVTIGDSLLLNTSYNTLNASQPLTISVWKYDLRKDYTVKLTNTGLPVVRVTASASYSQSVRSMRRDTWVPGITMRIELPDGTVDYEGTISLKGRGNQTWSDYDKKPFAIKLDEKSKILGMHKQKRWILLANVKDRTLLRNDLALWISRNTEMAYTVSGQHVELVWNGQHLGNYYLCEQARIDNHRIDIHDPNLEEPEKGGYFMAIDAFLGYDDPKWADKGQSIGFWTNSKYNMPYMFKDPDEDENGNPLTTSSPAYTYIYNYVRDMETAISNATSGNSHEWMNYLDANSAADFALIQELTMNHDAYNTWPKNGPKSTYIYKDSAGPICFGPIWDYDYHTFVIYNDFEYGNTTWDDSENQRLYQWEILKMTNKGGNKYYFADLKRDPLFKALLVERWNNYKYVWKNNFEDYVDMMVNKIRVSESYNEKIWGYPCRQNGDWCLTFDQAIQALKDAFKKRWQWIDQNIGKL